MMAKKKLLIPYVVNDSNKIESDRDRLFFLIVNSSLQQRLKIVRDPLLDLAAENKANDLADKDYFSHTSPDGVTANENVRSTGYILPDWYPVKSNNVESLALVNSNPKDLAQETLNMWTSSPLHRAHVFGEVETFRKQECGGVGKARTVYGGYVMVFISAPCMG